MLIQDFLRKYESHNEALLDLNVGYSITAKESERIPGLYLFKYDQIESDLGRPLVQECRGLILDSKNDWKVVAHPFHKFFNHGEGHAAKIDWKTAKVQEKLDGSMMTLYNYGGTWHVASSGNPDAAGEVNGFGFSFYSLFWKTWEEQKLKLAMCDPQCTYIFELTSPYNKVVVPHALPKLTLIGVRHLNNDPWSSLDVELPVADFKGLFPIVREFPLTSFDSILDSFKDIDGMRQEGYVVVDHRFNRVKVKHPQYVALHHLKDSLGGGNKSIVRILQTNEGSEFLTYFPEFKGIYDEINGKLHAMIDGLDEVYEILYDDANGNRGKVNRKDFAMKANQTKLPGYMFAKLDGKVKNVREYVSEMQIDSLMKMLNLK